MNYKALLVSFFVICAAPDVSAAAPIAASLPKKYQAVQNAYIHAAALMMQQLPEEHELLQALRAAYEWVEATGVRPKEFAQKRAAFETMIKRQIRTLSPELRTALKRLRAVAGKITPMSRKKKLGIGLGVGTSAALVAVLCCMRKQRNARLLREYRNNSNNLWNHRNPLVPVSSSSGLDHQRGVLRNGAASPLLTTSVFKVMRFDLDDQAMSGEDIIAQLSPIYLDSRELRGFLSAIDRAAVLLGLVSSRMSGDEFERVVSELPVRQIIKFDHKTNLRDPAYLVEFTSGQSAMCKTDGMPVTQNMISNYTPVGLINWPLTVAGAGADVGVGPRAAVVPAVGAQPFVCPPGLHILPFGLGAVTFKDTLQEQIELDIIKQAAEKIKSASEFNSLVTSSDYNSQGFRFGGAVFEFLRANKANLPQDLWVICGMVLGTKVFFIFCDDLTVLYVTDTNLFPAADDSIILRKAVGGRPKDYHLDANAIREIANS